MTNNILLLGGGFIGNTLAKRLAEQGKSVTVVSHRSPDRPIEGVNWRQGDLSDPTLMRELLSKSQSVVHLAATSTPGKYIHTPAREAEENLLPLLRLLELMGEETDIPLLFLSSGGAIYGNPVNLPATEKDVIAPLSNHAAGKASAEHFLGAFAHQGHPVTIIRPSNIYGPEQPLKSGFGLVRTLLEHIKHDTPVTIWGDGEIVRDYLYIDDLVTACLTILNSPMTGTFNIGSGLGYSINELCHLSEHVTDKKLIKNYQPERDVDIKTVILDNSHFRNNYTWKPQFTIEQGIHATWNWLTNKI